LSGIKTTIKYASLLFCASLLLTGCESADVDLMKSGLVRGGMDSSQASCYAEKAGDAVDGETYNYIAKLMAEGVEESQAINKARRKFGAEFKKPLKEARDACVK